MVIIMLQAVSSWEGTVERLYAVSLSHLIR